MIEKKYLSYSFINYIYIYIKTPFYKGAKYVPHLLEHVVALDNTMLYENYFGYSYNCELDTFGIYTIHKIPNYIDLEKYLQKIFTQPKKDIIISEKKVLKQELSVKNYIQKLYEQIGKRIYGGDFNNNNIQKHLTYTEIIKYHSQYYQYNNILVCDDQYNIIYDNYEYIGGYSNNISLLSDEYSFKSQVNGYLNYIMVKKYDGYQHYYLFFFLQELLTSYFEYKYRFQNKQYFYENYAYFFLFDDYYTLCITTYYDIGFDEEFFIQFNTQFKNIVLYDYGKKRIIINQLLWGVKVSLSEVINYIESLEYQYCLDFLAKIKQK